MSDIIDLTERRNAKEAPDAEFVRKDDFGRPLGLFLLEYEFDGVTWSADIWAYSAEEAQRRVMSMRQSLAYVGQAFTVTPA